MIKFDSKKEQIKDAVLPYLNKEGVSLFDFKIFRQHGKVNLRFLLDYKEGGINMAKCSELNRQIGKVIEEGNLFEGAFVLDVSSPGADRPLKNKDDFCRIIGREIDVYLSSPIDEKNQVSGMIKNVSDEGVLIDKGDQEYFIKYGQINKAKEAIKNN